MGGSLTVKAACNDLRYAARDRSDNTLYREDGFLIRLIALDLDGTVLGPDMRPAWRAREAIREAVARGVRVALATGRNFESSSSYARDLGLPRGPIIVLNGAAVREYPGGRHLLVKPLQLDIARDVIRFCKENRLYCQLHKDDETFSSMDCEWVRRHTEITGKAPAAIGDLQEYLHAPPLKLCIFGNKSELDFAVKSIGGMGGDRVYLTSSFPFVLEITDPGATKGSALEFSAGLLGIDRCEVMACGDSLNDVDMIEWAGVGVAMGDAVEAAKKAAHWVAPGGYGVGVAQAIERFVLNSGSTLAFSDRCRRLANNS